MTRFQPFHRAELAYPLTVADVYRLQEEGVISQDERFELIEGEIVPMAAAKSNKHEQMKQALIRRIARVLPERLGLFVETSITINEHTYVEPDICIFDVKHDTQKVGGNDILLAIEVASSSLGYDLVLKRDLYCRFGVRDYWVVDVDRLTVRVHREPLDGHYQDVEEYGRDDPIDALLVPEMKMVLASVLDQTPQLR